MSHPTSWVKCMVNYTLPALIFSLLSSNVSKAPVSTAVNPVSALHANYRVNPSEAINTHSFTSRKWGGFHDERMVTALICSLMTF